MVMTVRVTLSVPAGSGHGMLQHASSRCLYLVRDERYGTTPQHLNRRTQYTVVAVLVPAPAHTVTPAPTRRACACSAWGRIRFAAERSHGIQVTGSHGSHGIQATGSHGSHGSRVARDPRPPRRPQAAGAGPPEKAARLAATASCSRSLGPVQRSRGPVSPAPPGEGGWVGGRGGNGGE